MASFSIGDINKTGTTATINVNQDYAGQEYLTLIRLYKNMTEPSYWLVSAGQLYWVDPTVYLDGGVIRFHSDYISTAPSAELAFTLSFVSELMECRFDPPSDGVFCEIVVAYDDGSGSLTDSGGVVIGENTPMCYKTCDLSPAEALVRSFSGTAVADPVNGSSGSGVSFDYINNFYEYSLNARIDGNSHTLNIHQIQDGLFEASLGILNHVTIDSFYGGSYITIGDMGEFAKLYPNKSVIDIGIIVATYYRDKEGALHTLSGVVSKDTFQLEVRNTVRLKSLELYDCNRTLNYMRFGELSEERLVSKVEGYFGGLSTLRLRCEFYAYYNTTLNSVQLQRRNVNYEKIGNTTEYGTTLYVATYDLPNSNLPQIYLTAEAVDSRNLTAYGSDIFNRRTGSYSPPRLSGSVEKYCEGTLPTTSIEDFKEIKCSYTPTFTGYNFGFKKNDIKVAGRLVDSETLETVGRDIVFLEHDTGAVSGTMRVFCFNGSDLGTNITIDAFKDYKLVITIQDGALTLPDGTIGCLTTKTYEIDVQSPKPIFDFGENSFNLNVDLLIKNENIFDLIYPKGSIYITTQNSVPEHFKGTWASRGSASQSSATIRYFERIN